MTIVMRSTLSTCVEDDIASGNEARVGVVFAAGSFGFGCHFVGAVWMLALIIIAGGGGSFVGGVIAEARLRHCSMRGGGTFHSIVR